MATNRLALCCTDYLTSLLAAPRRAERRLGYFLYFQNKKKRKAKMRRWRGVVTGSRWPGALTSPARGHSALITLPLPAARPLGVAAGRQSIFFIASTTITRQQTPQRLAHMRCTFHTSSDASTRVATFVPFYYYLFIYLWYHFILFYLSIRVLCSGLFLGTSLFLFFVLWRQSHSSSFRTTQSLQHIMEAPQHTADPFYKVSSGPPFTIIKSE
jgi:hypothetical protein